MWLRVRVCRHVLTCAAALFALHGCAGDPAANGRVRDDDEMAGGQAGQGGAAAGGGGAPAAPAAGAMATPAMMAPPSAPAATPGGAPSGTFKPRASLDPAVSFDWPESAPGDGSQCQAGTYTGTFVCMFTDPSGFIPPIELTGPVSLTFTKSMDGEFLEISNGLFEAVANLFVGARANITGKLDCDTLTLNATVADGMWAIGDPNAPLLPGGVITGDIVGTLDPATGTLSGDWSFSDPAVGSCPGMWSVTYAP